MANSDMIARALAKKNSTELADITSTTPSIANLLNAADADYRVGYYCHPSTGNMTANAAYDTSGFIAVTEGDNIVVTRQPASGGRAIYKHKYVVGFNSSKVFVSASSTDLEEYVVPAGVSYIRVTIYHTNPEPMIEKINDNGISIAYLDYTESTSKSISRAIVEAFLPREICVAVGRTIEVYNRAVCPQANKYRIKWMSTIGAVTDRKISITGATPATTWLYMWILDDEENVLWSAVSRVKVVAASTVTKTICPIGDSLTNGKAWLAEIINLNTNFSFVGGISFSLADAGSVTRTGKHEGHSGWAAETYMTLATYDSTANPFWDSTLNSGAGGFSWAYYVTNTLAGVAPDIVQIFLGMNGLEYDPDENAGYIKAMVDVIRADAPTLPIYVVTPQYKAYAVSSYASIGLYSYGENLKTLRLCNAVTELLSGYANLYFVPVTQCFDSEYNYNSGTTLANPRISTTVPSIADAIHPANYFQMADVMFSSLSAHIS